MVPFLLIKIALFICFWTIWSIGIFNASIGKTERLAFITNLIKIKTNTEDSIIHHRTSLYMVCWNEEIHAKSSLSYSTVDVE